MDIYDRINLRLGQKGLTRRQLCDAAGLSYSTLTSQFQRRSKNMSLETIRAIAKTLHVSADYLLLGDEANPYFVSEEESDGFGQDQKDEREIVAIFRNLSKRSKTMLLAKAYELNDKETAEPETPKTTK
jgi:transcriptional regulator with XRE-family HTH domain